MKTRMQKTKTLRRGQKAPLIKQNLQDQQLKREMVGGAKRGHNGANVSRVFSFF